MPELWTEVDPEELEPPPKENPRVRVNGLDPSPWPVLDPRVRLA